MKIVLTGSIGRIGKHLATKLVARGHAITVISSNTDRRGEIEQIGAKAAIGSLMDSNFLAVTFNDADVVYLMEPPFNFFDHSIDTEKYWLDIAKSYVESLRQTNVTKVIHLSSIGGHTNTGVGMLATHHYVEQLLKELSETVIIKTMRPVGFYYNMFAFIPTIQHAGSIFQNYGDAPFSEPWVSPLDIADTIAEEMELPFTERSVRYIASEEVTPDEVAAALGEAIGKPDLKWVVIPDAQFESNLIHVGFNPQAAKGLTEMNAGRRNQLYDDYHNHKPAFGKVKLKEFAAEFARVYHDSTGA